MAAASRNTSEENRKRIRLVAQIVIVAAIALALALWVFWPRPLEVDTAPVMRGEIDVWVEEQAITRVPHVHKVTMPIAGRLQPVQLAEGDAVRQGEVVARLEVDDLQSALAAAEARVALVDAQLDEARDVQLELTALKQVQEFLVSIDRTVEAAEERTRASRARRDFTADQLRRAEQAHAAGALAETELDRRRLEAVEADVSYRADVLTLRAVVATQAAGQIAPQFIHELIEQRTHRRQILGQEWRTAQEALQQRRRELERSQITSPVDGVVFSRAVVDEAALPEGALILEIGQLEALEVEAEVLSEEVVRFTVGAPAIIFGGAVGDPPLRAQVARIYPQAFTKISALGIEQQRVLVVLRFEPGEVEALLERGRQLGADFRVRVRVLVDRRVDALRIPRTALFRGPDGAWQTFAVRAGRAELVSLHVGLVTQFEAEVVDGLGEGDRVVLSPPGELATGQRVRAR